jgi:hypothetical protein
MRERLTRACGAGLCFCLLAGTAEAVVIGFVPADSIVPLGGAVEIGVMISDLGDGVPPSLGAFDLGVSFDPAILSPTGVTFGAFLGDPALLEAITGESFFPGLLEPFEISLLLEPDLEALQPGAFILATLSFDAVGAGTSPLVFSRSILGDGLGDPLSADSLAGSVRVIQAAPAPPTAWLLLAGLLAARIARGVKARRTP